MSKLLTLLAVAILVIFAAASSIQAQQMETATFGTPLGKLIGKKNHYGGMDFLGVRFAQPPVGKLRFQPAQPIEPWTEPQNATYNKAGCIQDCKGGRMVKLMCPSTFSEDCLYMNIFTPTMNTSANLPVIIFYHGGMYTWGSAEIPLYDGAEWAQRNNMIVVTTNYRLNIFSGLMTHHISGNFGTTDQIEVLKFMKKILGSVGGNPNDVTISGQSSGAFSVSILLTTQKAFGLFNKAVIFSDPIGFTAATQKMATELGELCTLKAKCPVGSDANATAQLECLQSLTAKELLDISKTSYLPTPNQVLSVILQWQPAIDGKMITADPIAQFEKGAFAPIDALYVSNVANETAIFVDSLNIDVKTWLLDVAIDYIFGLTDAASIEKLYGKIPPDFGHFGTKAGIMFFSTILQDYTFLCPIRHVADIVASKGVRTYYGFYDIVESWVKPYLDNPQNLCNEEVCHAFDLPNYFYNPYILPSTGLSLKPDEIALAHFMQDSVGSMVTSGRITTPGFNQYNTTTRAMMNYSLPMPTNPMSNYRENYCAFWNKIGWNRH